MNFLAHLGFITDTEKSYWELWQQVTEYGQTIVTPESAYFRWTPSKNLELWAKVKPTGDIGYLHPHYAGDSIMHVALVEKVAYEDEKDVLADGFFVAYAKPQQGVGFVSEHKNLHYGDGTYSSYIPFVFNAPDFDRYADLQIPTLVDVQLTAFALMSWSYESEDEWIDKQVEWDTSGEEDPYVWSGETFAPSTMLYERKGPNDFPRPTAYIAGTILDTAIITNPVTEEEFCWACIETVAGQLDVVASIQKLNGYMVTGGVIAGDFYLSGRLVDDMDV